MIIKLNKALPKIRQIKNDWCIPASIEIALKYLMPGFLMSQEDIARINNAGFSFGNYKKALENESNFNYFSFEHYNPTDDQSRIDKIKEYLKKDSPILLSLPVQTGSFFLGWHIRVCCELDDNRISMLDPGNAEITTLNIKAVNKLIKIKGGGDLLGIALK
ncbi:MAG TPA: C39 family peptidase [Candidatus Moranbacteria bacterium]|nr:C39 family peptidase [Candidatus Moranbacteria bacterium]